MRLEASITLPFSCHAVECSPFLGERQAVATAQYFGIVGNGRLHIVDRDSRGGDGDGRGGSPAMGTGLLREVRTFDTQAGLFDCAWSECHPYQIVTAGADGVVKLWDLGTADGFPMADWREHTQEASGVDWNLVSKSSFASSSWDGTVKVWQPDVRESSITFRCHDQRHPVYGAIWNPHSAGQLFSFSGDGTARVLDVNSRLAGVVLDGHGDAEVLSGDWDKYNRPVVATGCADGTARVWDLRKPRSPLFVTREHRYALRRLRFSPHPTSILATASYDTTVVLWDVAKMIERPPPPPPPPRAPPLSSPSLVPSTVAASVLDRVEHAEFVAGVAFSLFEPGVMATCAWDRHLTCPSLKDRNAKSLKALVRGQIHQLHDHGQLRPAKVVEHLDHLSPSSKILDSSEKSAAPSVRGTTVRYGVLAHYCAFACRSAIVPHGEGCRRRLR